MLDAANEPGVQRIVFMTGAGVGKTSVLDAILGYFSHHDPSPMLFVLPTLKEGEGYSKERLAAMIEESPSLRRIFGDPRSRDSGNTVLYKDFPGGYVAIAGANSAASLQRRHVRFVACDEVDSFQPDADGEGDPADLAFQRMARFQFTRLGILAGSPTTRGVSRLERAWDESDQRRFWVPCGACGEFQILKWERVRWDRHDPTTARYACASCGDGWKDAARLAAIRRGEWRAGAPFRGTAGFHIWEAYATARLELLVAEWLEKNKATTSRQTFVNKKLGELWEADGEGVEWAALRARAEPYAVVGDDDFVLPDWVLFLAAGTDTQNDRLETQLIGFGRAEECGPVGYLVFEGDPIEDRVWEEHDRDVLFRTFRHPRGGELAVAGVAIDTGGQRTQAVYNYCRTRAPRVMAIKGSTLPGRPIIAGRPSSQDVSFRGARIANGVRLWTIGTDTAKADLYGRFAIEQNKRVDEETGEEISLPTPRFVHFPNSFPAPYFEGVVSERVVARYHRGVARMEWVLPSGKRNEPLDTFVYAYAVAVAKGLHRMNWDALEASIGDKRPRTPPQAPPPPSSSPESWIPSRPNWLR